MSVCYKEGVKVAPNALAEIIMASGGDIRQVMSCDGHVTVMGDLLVQCVCYGEGAPVLKPLGENKMSLISEIS